MKTENREKKLKTEPKLKVELSEQQKQVTTNFYNYDISFVVGKWGSGKSLSAIHTAIVAKRKYGYDKIFITKPIVKNNLGILPGNIDDKLSPYMFCVVQNFEICQGKDVTERELTEGKIEIIPVETAKGMTFVNAIVIIDEFEDFDKQDFITMLTRLGKDSKMILCGSKQQIDRSMVKISCYPIVEALSESGLVGYVELDANFRNESLKPIMDYLENKDLI